MQENVTLGGGVLVVVCVVVVLVLVNVIQARNFGALRRLWHRKKVVRKKPAEETAKPVETGATEAQLPSENAPVASGSGAVRAEEERQIPVEDAAVESKSVQSEAHERDQRSEESLLMMIEAQRLWDAAREIPYAFIPDPETDGKYLAKVYRAATLGHPEALAKLGDYAYRRGVIVEAYYWTALADLKGAKGLNSALREMRARWMAEGCPTQYDNVYEGFSEIQGSFARALLRIRSAVGAPRARMRMRELAEQGCEAAQLFLLGKLPSKSTAS